MWYRVTKSAATLSRDVLQNGRQILVAHLVYSGLGIIALFPLVGLLGRLLLGFSGKPALTDEDILYFVLTPFGFVSAVVLGSLSLFVVAFEQSSMITIARAAQRRQNITVLEALQHSLNQAPRILFFALRLVIRLLVLILPFLAAMAVVVLTLLAEYDINFYLASRPPAFWLAAVLVGALFLTVCWLFIRKLLDWSMSLPLVIFSEISPAACFHESARLMSASRVLLLTLLAAWFIASVALGALVVSSVWLLSNLLLIFVGDSLLLLVFVLGAALALGFLATFFVTAFTSGAFAYLIADFFARIGPGSSSPSSLTTPMGNHPRLSVFRGPSPKRLAILLGASAVIAGLAGIWLVNGIRIDNDVAVIAHRGAAGSAPENTLASVRQAIADNADWIEIDVQETADGEIVVVHDSDFMKMAGVNLNVWNSSLDQVRAIDVGSWFAPEFADERVPTLTEVLDESRGRSRVIIELKYYGHDQALEERVVAIVEQSGMVNDVMLMSLNYDGIQKIRALRPDWTIGLLVAQAAGNIAQLDVDFLAIHSGIAVPRLIRAANESGKQVFVWTINDAVNMSRMLSLGIDGIITDEPRLARAVLEDRNNMSTSEKLLLHTALLLGRRTPERDYRDQSP